MKDKIGYFIFRIFCKMGLFPDYGIDNWATRFQYEKHGIYNADKQFEKAHDDLIRMDCEYVKEKYKHLLDKNEPEAIYINTIMTRFLDLDYLEEDGRVKKLSYKGDS